MAMKASWLSGETEECSKNVNSIEITLTTTIVHSKDYYNVTKSRHCNLATVCDHLIIAAFFISLTRLWQDVNQMLQAARDVDPENFLGLTALLNLWTRDFVPLRKWLVPPQ